MFLGTDLQINGDGKTIRGVDEALVIDNNEDEYYLSEIKPLIKPLSSITFEEEQYLIKECGRRFDKTDNRFGFDGAMSFEDTYKAINFLASKHYDIFNWIERGLAEEIK